VQCNARLWRDEGLAAKSRKALMRRRERDVKPIPSSQAERRLESVRRLEENHQVEIQARAACDARC